MFEGPNKYEVELAIDQQKIAQGKTDEIELSFDGRRYQYGPHEFQSREQAIYWIRRQVTDKDFLTKEISAERLRYKEKGENSPLEELFTTFENYLKQESLAKNITKGNLNTLLNQRIKNNPVDYKPKDYGLLGALQGEELTYKPTERILPLTDIFDKDNTLSHYTFSDMGEFISRSISDLGGSGLDRETAQIIASRLVVITSRNGSTISRGNGFIHEGKIWTNHHVIEDGVSTIRDLEGNEIKNITIHTVGNPNGKEMLAGGTPGVRDIAYISSPDLEKKQYSKELNMSKLSGDYIIGVKFIKSDIALGEKNSNPIAIFVNKIKLGENPRDRDESFSYIEGGTTESGTSGSMVIHDGKIIGINSYGAQSELYIPFFGSRIILSKKRRDISGGGELFEGMRLNNPK